MIPKRRFDFSDVYLYVITSPPPPRPGRFYLETVAEACAGGADAVQLRDKTLAARDLVHLCRELQSLCDKTGALFILNDRVDVALAADVDGVHVGQDDLPVRAVRSMVGHRKLIGCSTHSIAQALTAAGDGADYVSCGPVFATPTKPDYAPVGLDRVKEYKKLLRVPFVAIGGIDESNVDQVLLSGAERVAVVRAVSGADSIEGAARTFKEKISRFRDARRHASPGD